MTRNLVFRRRALLPASEVLAAWVDPEMLARWLWPQADDAVFEPSFARGEEFRFASARLGRTISGRCLDFNKYGIDFSWRVESEGVRSCGGHDIVSVRAQAAGRGSTFVVTHAVHTNRSASTVDMWDPALDRLAALRPGGAMPADEFGSARVGRLRYA